MKRKKHLVFVFFTAAMMLLLVACAIKKPTVGPVSPDVTATPTPTQVPAATPTPTQVPATDTPTPTQIPATDTPTPTPTESVVFSSMERVSYYNGDGSLNYYDEFYYDANQDLVQNKSFDGDGNLLIWDIYYEDGGKISREYKDGTLYYYDEIRIDSGKKTEISTNYNTDGTISYSRTDKPEGYEETSYFENGNKKKYHTEYAGMDGNGFQEILYLSDGQRDVIHSGWENGGDFDNSRVDYVYDENMNLLQVIETTVGASGGMEYSLRIVTDCKKDETKPDTYVKVKKTTFNSDDTVVNRVEYNADGEWKLYNPDGMVMETGKENIEIDNR